MKRIEFRAIVDFVKRSSNQIECSVRTDGYISTMCNLQELEDHAICWIKNRKCFSEEVANRLKSVEDILVVAPFLIEGIDCIVTDYPKGVFFNILNNFFSDEFEHTISPDSRILTRSIGKNVHIGPNCYIAADVSIGDNTIIHPNVNIICPCTIGHDCEIYPGVVIGADGFGYYFENEIPYREKHFMGVRIGSNSCIDRGLITDTIIKDHVKIDNLCHISHNVVIEENCLVIVGTVICGSSHIMKNSYLAPGSVILNQVVVEEHGKVGANSLAVNRVKAGTTVLGVPGKKYSIE